MADFESTFDFLIQSTFYPCIYRSDLVINERQKDAEPLLLHSKFRLQLPVAFFQRRDSITDKKRKTKLLESMLYRCMPV